MIVPTDRLSLAQHDGPYEDWPLKTELHLDGRPTGREVPGYQVCAQFTVGGDFLLVTDWDCPFEEIYDVLLLSPDLRVRSRASEPARFTLFGGTLLGAVSVASRNLFCEAEVIGPRTVLLRGCSKPPHLEITVRERRPLGVGSLLRLRVVDDAPTAG